MATVVDMIRTIYKELYKVKFVHTGYGSPRPNSISDDLTVQPDADTRVIFNNHNIVYHFFNDTLVDESGRLQRRCSRPRKPR